MAVAVDRNGRSHAQYVWQRAPTDAGVPPADFHDGDSADLQMDGRQISGDVQGDPAAGEGGALGDRWRDVGGTGPEPSGRRIACATVAVREALLSAEVRRRCEDRLESGFVWL